MPDQPNDDDGDAIRRVVDTGSCLTRPMEIDFHVAAPTLAIAEIVGGEAVKLGFRVSISKDKSREQYTCTCSKTMILSHPAVQKEQQLLSEISVPLGAYPDGWGTFGNTDGSAAN